MAKRTHSSIGDVLEPAARRVPRHHDLEDPLPREPGLIDPERTPSGYRKFYPADVERLRFILRQQREHFLPLKVIKERLDEVDRDAAASPSPATPADDAAGADRAPSIRPPSTPLFEETPPGRAERRGAIGHRARCATTTVPTTSPPPRAA